MEHGSYSIDLKQGCIVVRLIGAFNCEGMALYIDAMKAAIQQIQSSKLSIVINHLEFEGAGPEALELINQYNSWLDCHYIVNKAFVGTQAMYQYIAENKMTTGLNQCMQFFDSEEGAINWLLSES